jgi:hypothetical protein
LLQTDSPSPSGILLQLFHGSYTILYCCVVLTELLSYTAVPSARQILYFLLILFTTVLIDTRAAPTSLLSVANTIPSISRHEAMRVDQLLNPVETAGSEEWTSIVTTVPQVQAAQPPPRSSHQSPRSRGQKLPKDAPIFRKGDPKGSVQFPPHEAGDDEDLKEQHRLFQVYPMGEIADYCHHIPYSSDKKTFLSKTGRDAFEGE